MALKSIHLDKLKNLTPLVQRTNAIRESLVAQYTAGRGAPNEVVGNEREIFIRSYLANAYPPQFRWSSGFIIDAAGTKTGQLDIVVEANLGLSIPATSTASERLFFAEMVAGVISVKSNLFAQWQQVLDEAEKVRALKIERHAWFNVGERLDHVPFFIVAYSGAKEISTLREKITKELGDVLHSLIVLDSSFCLVRSPGPSWVLNAGTSAFLVFAASLHQQIVGSMDMGQTIWPYVCETEAR